MTAVAAGVRRGGGPPHEVAAETLYELLELGMVGGLEPVEEAPASPEPARFEELLVARLPGRGEDDWAPVLGLRVPSWQEIPEPAVELAVAILSCSASSARVNGTRSPGRESSQSSCGARPTCARAWRAARNTPQRSSRPANSDSALLDLADSVVVVREAWSPSPMSGALELVPGAAPRGGTT